MATLSHTPSRRLWLGAAVAGLLGAVFAGCSRGTHVWHRPGHGLHGATSMAQARDRAHEAGDRLLRHLDADDGQRNRVRAVIDGSVTRLFPLHEQHRAYRTEWLDALSREQLDRQELEALRRAELELADAASRELIDNLVDTWQILEPEQRARVLEHVRRRDG